LAVIGFSLNDNIVVSDRIRENFRKIRGATPREIVDIALTETLRRTIHTSMTLLLVVVSMMFLGGDGLNGSLSLCVSGYLSELILRFISEQPLPYGVA
jgi:preprotein translocase subunit SecF